MNENRCSNPQALDVIVLSRIILYSNREPDRPDSSAGVQHVGDVLDVNNISDHIKAMAEASDISTEIDDFLYPL